MTCAVDMRLPNYLQGDGTQGISSIPFTLSNVGLPQFGWPVSGRGWTALGYDLRFLFGMDAAWRWQQWELLRSAVGRCLLGSAEQTACGLCSRRHLTAGSATSAGEGAIREIGEKVPLRNPGAARLPIRRQNRSRRVALRQGQQGADRNCAMLLAILVHPVRSSGLARKAHCL